MITLDRKEIIPLLPHPKECQYLESAKLEPGKYGEGIFRATGEEHWFFPANPVVPRYILLEAIAQLAGLVLVTAKPGSVPGFVDDRFPQRKRVGKLEEVHIKAALIRDKRIKVFAVEAETEKGSVGKGRLWLVLT